MKLHVAVLSIGLKLHGTVMWECANVYTICVCNIYIYIYIYMSYYFVRDLEFVECNKF